MTTTEYKLDNPDCECAKWFPRVGGCIVVPTKPVTRLVVGSRSGWHVPADHVHHVVGETRKGRENDPRNMLSVCDAVHDFFHAKERLSPIICCTELRRKGLLDWAYLSRLDYRCWPGKFDIDDCIRQAREFPWLEALRVELLRKAA